MSIKVIGAGFGRTGTLSLKVALEILGFGPCYHMREIIPFRPLRAKSWYEASQDCPVDWPALFRSYQAPSIGRLATSTGSLWLLIPKRKLS